MGIASKQRLISSHTCSPRSAPNFRRHSLWNWNISCTLRNSWFPRRRKTWNRWINCETILDQQASYFVWAKHFLCKEIGHDFDSFLTAIDIVTWKVNVDGHCDSEIEHKPKKRIDAGVRTGPKRQKVFSKQIKSRKLPCKSPTRNHSTRLCPTNKSESGLQI